MLKYCMIHYNFSNKCYEMNKYKYKYSKSLPVVKYKKTDEQFPLELLFTKCT